MTRHLHSTDTLLSVGTRQVVWEIFAEKVASGEILWNPETDVMVAAEVATADDVAETDRAVRRLLAKVMLERAQADIARSLS